MKFNRIFYVVFILAIASVACFSTPTATSGNTLFTDDFSNTGSGWDRVDETDRTTNYYNDAYRIVVNQTNYDAWANPGNKSFTDVHIEVEATKNGGPDDNDFGIICRYTSTTEFYYGIISSDGYYAIMKMTSDGGKQIGGESMLQSDKITQGAATNLVRFDCIGSTLTLYVNGNQIDQQTDTDYTSGNVGLIAGTFGTAGTDMLFDNFFVYKP